MLPLSMLFRSSEPGMFRGGLDVSSAVFVLGGLIGVVAGLVLLLVGVVLRLGGGPGKPLDVRRAVLIGAAIPGAAGLLGLVLGVLA